MTKRKGLSELTRRVPSPDEISTILDQVRKSSDISAAITATAIVEARLEVIIARRFEQQDAGLMEKIFQNRGPLSDFNSKILLAHAMGAITGPLAQELHNIRAIRNAFAHSKLHLTFEEAALKAHVSNFGMLAAMIALDTDELPRMSELPVKQQFMLVLQIVLIMFDELAETNDTADKVIDRILRE